MAEWLEVRDGFIGCGPCNRLGLQGRIAQFQIPFAQAEQRRDNLSRHPSSASHQRTMRLFQPTPAASDADAEPAVVTDGVPSESDFRCVCDNYHKGFKPLQHLTSPALILAIKIQL